ncbi:GNAT family N-acetyltransferase [Alkalicoccus chagannorensis]|uniref:GNAT family N-acetyltransferase n=1 Tax=Alkalicoccus chagannorensis TaxID=427072 RepID=UPI0003FFB81E|nr:GNAT family N-acetyltransferase [Alkalicoccus chagannorensis]
MQIRHASVEEAAAIADVQVQSWQTTYRGIVPASYLEAMKPENRIGKWQQILRTQPVFAADNEHGQLVGFAHGGPKRTEDYPDYDGELYAVYLLEQAQRQGLGTALFQAVLHDLHDRGMASLLVSVLAENPACRFYEAHGAQLIDTTSLTIDGAQLEERIYGWQ